MKRISEEGERIPMYVNKKYRLRTDIKIPMRYIEWRFLLEGKSADETKQAFNQMVEDGIAYIKNRKVEIDNDTDTESISYPVETETYDRLLRAKKETGFYLSRVIEVSIYLFCKRYFSEEEWKKNRMDKWKVLGVR